MLFDAPQYERGFVTVTECLGSVPAEPVRIGEADRDVIALGIALAAILLFVGTGGTVLPPAIRSLQGIEVAPDKALVNALLLNIALVIFGWRRYRQLSQEVLERSEAEERARLLAETDPLTAASTGAAWTPQPNG